MNFDSKVSLVFEGSLVQGEPTDLRSFNPSVLVHLKSWPQRCLVSCSVLLFGSCHFWGAAKNNGTCLANIPAAFGKRGWGRKKYEGNW